ncbi:DH domain-containing protein [Mycena venus]|uniref:DH domain-containing protein n=1 Tax=Mycena venus TaxID=2733690 RepID=A0A8H7C938_9AGAR|nr:DH domain-containing protein [Mycena venus]
MPISSNSDSSFEFRNSEKSKPVENKRFSISGGGSKSASRNASKRESHMTNLPLVEAQLLPSLRDTIDRMTRPPSRIFTPSSPPENDVNANKLLPVVPPTAQIPAIDNPSYSISPLPPSTPKPLKSALRAPTPKLQLRSPRSPAVLPTSYNEGQAEGRSLTGASTTPRLPSGSGNGYLASSASKNNGADASASSTSIRTRERSRTDPGAPQAPHTSITANKSDPRDGAKGSSTASNIPRPRATSGLRSASSTPRPRLVKTSTDSSSDLELRYELEARNRRSLRVVNGVLSSESESDGEARAGVGLGLRLVAPYPSQSFASKLRARFSRSNSDAGYAADEAAERRRKELLGLVQGLDQLGSQLQGHGQPEDSNGGDDDDYGVVVSGSGRVDFGAATSQAEPPRVMVSSSSGLNGELERDAGKNVSRRERERPTSLWQRSRSLSPAPPPLPKGQVGLMPGALRRHSVYHSVPSRPVSPVRSPPEPEPRYAPDECSLLSQSPESLYDEPDEGELAQELPRVQDPPTSSHLPVPDHRQSRFQRHSDDLVNSDTVILALHSRLAAAERETPGIPPSASDAGYPGQGKGERMSYVDSGLSLARVGMSWEDGEGRASGRGAGVLSFGAEKLFRTLSGRTVDGGGKRDSWNGNGNPEYAFGQDDILKGRRMDGIRPTSMTFSQSSSASSVYEDDKDARGSEHSEEPWHGEESAEEEEGHGENEEGNPMDEATEDAWRSTVSPTTYAAVVDRYGGLEVHRQEAIRALCVTEESFVSRLTNTINLFILPLRMQDSKCYISGVPAEIAKLFDWLEDILNLHAHLLSALRYVRETQHPVVERVAEAIRTSFVKRLEIYQPYLVRLVNVAGTIARLIADTTSDFGEFVRIQESSQECGGWSLESLLVDPVTRLGKYSAIFRKMLESTPKVHADYVPTLALVHSTEMVIKVMTEVKVREDEYDLVKSMSQRIKGLPSSVSLAKRGRRLLCEGQLLWVRTDPCLVAGAQLLNKESPPTDDHRNMYPRENTGAQKRSSNLVDAIHEWDQRRERSGSNASASTAASSYSLQSAAQPSKTPRAPPSPHLSFRGVPKAKLPESSRPSTQQDSLRFSSSNNETDPRFEETQLVQIFVFTDCVVVARASKSHYNGSEEWKLIEKVGIGKILNVTEVSDDSNNISPLLELDVLPADLKNLGELGVISDCASLEVLHLRVPPSDLPSNHEDLYKTWLSAFQQSSRLTLRAISNLGGSTTQLQYTDLGGWDGQHPIPISQRSLPKTPNDRNEKKEDGGRRVFTKCLENSNPEMRLDIMCFCVWSLAKYIYNVDVNVATLLPEHRVGD